MFLKTLERVRCPGCASHLTLDLNPKTGQRPPHSEIREGELLCSRCASRYPIIAGVAILVTDVESYVAQHAKGISRLVSDEQIPEAYRDTYRDAVQEFEVEHIEEDLEAERVVALYVMNHFLRVAATDPRHAWWKPKNGRGASIDGDPLIAELVERYWDNGPFSKIKEWTGQLALSRPLGSILELGCGVGGLSLELKEQSQSYLGIDSSFSSIALGRHLALGAKYDGAVRVPGDLLDGTVSVAPFSDLSLRPTRSDGSADLVVGDFESLPIAEQSFDLCLALNSIDMLDDPALLPKLQRATLRPSGVAIQSCPYIWSNQAASMIREQLPPAIVDSAGAVEWMYEQVGFKIERRAAHVPWLFFKHLRQLEIYSVHMIQCK